MNNIKIFRANRGEGKTKWLAEKIKEGTDAGFNCYYVGGDMSFRSVKEVYEAIFRERCPLKRSEESHSTTKNCFFTDGYFDDLLAIRMQQIGVHSYRDPWYITMNKEDFVN